MLIVQNILRFHNIYALVPSAILAAKPWCEVAWISCLITLSLIIKNFWLSHPYDSRNRPPTRILFQDFRFGDIVSTYYELYTFKSSPRHDYPIARLRLHSFLCLFSSISILHYNTRWPIYSFCTICILSIIYSFFCLRACYLPSNLSGDYSTIVPLL